MGIMSPFIYPKKYEFAGLAIHAKGNPARINTAMEATFRMLPTTLAPPDIELNGNGYPLDKIDAVLPMWIRDELTSDQPAMEPKLLFGKDGGIAAVASKDEFLFCAWLQGAGSDVQYVCSMDEAGSRIGMFQPVLIPILREAFARKGCLLIHGASVLCPNQTGLLIIAPSGGGKTTTALSLVRNGARLLGDDLVGIRIFDGEPKMYGIPEPMNLTDETISFFSETQRFANVRSAPGYAKKAVVPQDVYGNDCMINSCRLHQVVFVSITQGKPAMRALSPGESLRRLILSHAFAGNQKTGATTVSKLCEVLAGAAAYELETGSDPVRLGTWMLDKCSDS